MTACQKGGEASSEENRRAEDEETAVNLKMFFRTRKDDVVKKFFHAVQQQCGHDGLNWNFVRLHGYFERSCNGCKKTSSSSRHVKIVLEEKCLSVLFNQSTHCLRYIEY